MARIVVVKTPDSADIPYWELNPGECMFLIHSEVSAGRECETNEKG